MRDLNSLLHSKGEDRMSSPVMIRGRVGRLDHGLPAMRLNGMAPLPRLENNNDDSLGFQRQQPMQRRY